MQRFIRGGTGTYTTVNDQMISPVVEYDDEMCELDFSSW